VALADAVQAEIDGTTGSITWDFAGAAATDTITTFNEGIMNVDGTYYALMWIIDPANGDAAGGTIGELVAVIDGITGISATLDAAGLLTIVPDVPGTPVTGGLSLGIGAKSIVIAAEPVVTVPSVVGSLANVLESATANGASIDFVAANIGTETFSVASTMDYQGQTQIASAAFSTTESDYYVGGTTEIVIDIDADPATDNSVTISAPMEAPQYSAKFVIEGFAPGFAMTGDMVLDVQAGADFKIDTDLINVTVGTTVDQFLVQVSNMTAIESAAIIDGKIEISLTSTYIGDGSTAIKIDFSGLGWAVDSGTPLVYLGTDINATGWQDVPTTKIPGIPSTAALVDAINAQTNVTGTLNGVIGGATLDVATNTITLESAANSEHVFDITSSTISYEGVLQVATLNYSTNNADYYKDAVGATDRIYATISGVDYYADMVAGDAAATVQALADAISANMPTNVGTVDVQFQTTIALTANAPMDTNAAFTVDMVETEVQGVKQVTQISFAGLADKAGYNEPWDTNLHVFATDDNGDAGTISIDIAGVIVTANMADTVEQTTQNLADRIIALRDGSGGVTQDAEIALNVGDASVIYTPVGGFAIMSNIGTAWIGGGGTRNYAPEAITAQLETYPGFQVMEGWLNGDQFVTDTFYTSLSDWALDAEAYWQIADPTAGVNYDAATGQLTITTSEYVGQMGIPYFKFSDYTADELLITAAEGGVDQLLVNGGAAYSITTPYVDGNTHEVTLQFSNSILDSADMLNEIISVTVHGVTTDIVVSAPMLAAAQSANPDPRQQSEYIVSKILDAVIADHQTLANAGFPTNLDLAAAATAQTGNLLVFSSTVVGAGTLDAVTASVTMNDQAASNPVAVIVDIQNPGAAVVQASTSTDGITISADGTGNSVLGVAQFFASTDDTTIVPADYGIWLAEQAIPGELNTPIGQTIINPSATDPDNYGDSALTAAAGLEQTAANPSDDPSLSGDDASTGEAGGVTQAQLNPADGYTAVDGSPEAGTTVPTGIDTMYGAAPGDYTDGAVYTDHKDGGTATTDATGTYFDDSTLYLADGNNGKEGGIVGAYASEDTDLGSNISVTVDDTGYAQFSSTDATADTISVYNPNADVVSNFQAENGTTATPIDQIVLEGDLALSTAVAAVNATVAGQEFPEGLDLSTVEFGVVSSAVNAGQSDSEPDSISVGAETSGLDYSIGTSSISISIDGGNTFDTYSIGTLDTLNDLADAINQGGLVTADVGNGRFTLTELVASDELQAVFDLELSWNDSFIVKDTYVETLVTPAETSVTASELENADAVAALLGDVFFTGTTTDNSVVNTTVFAVTASDDPNQTAIWAHTQTTTGDATIDANDLSLLSMVNTLDTEFSFENFAIDYGGTLVTPEVLISPLIA
jgi:hypothetical protein